MINYINKEDMGGVDGWSRLFEYYEGLEGDLGEQIEINIIASCYDWGYYKDLDELMLDYSCVLGDYDNKDEVIKAYTETLAVLSEEKIENVDLGEVYNLIEDDLLRGLEANTTVLRTDKNGYLVQAF